MIMRKLAAALTCAVWHFDYFSPKVSFPFFRPRLLQTPAPSHLELIVTGRPLSPAPTRSLIGNLAIGTPAAV